MAELYGWQLPAKDKLVAGFKSGALCMLNTSDTGTGKTLVAVQAIKELARPALIVCPKAVKATWRYWADEMGAGDKLLDVINPERISLGKSPFWTGEKWVIPEGAMVVVDEAHKGCSGPDSKMTKAIALLKAYKVPVLAQSATIASSPLQMRAIGYLLGQHTFGKSSFYDWCLRNGCVRGYENSVEFRKGPIGEAAMAKLHKSLADRMVRIRISEVPDFPECATEAKLFNLSDHATAEINKEYAEAARKIAKNPSGDPMIHLLRARQITELMKVPLLLDLIDDIVEENESAAVFVTFRDTIRALMDALTHPRIAIWGRSDDPDGRKRDADVAKFQRNEATVCIAQAGAGGVGVSLHDVNKTRPRRSLITPSFNASEIKQCLGRIHRSGGTKAIQTFVLVAGTIEEQVYKSLQAKLKCISSLNDGDLMGGLKL